MMMKKLLMIAFLALVGAAQAAVDFTANNLGTGYEGYKITLNGWIGGELMSIDTEAVEKFENMFLTKESTETWAEHYATVTESLAQKQTIGTVVDGTGLVSFTKEIEGKAEWFRYSAIFMLFKDGIAPGSQYAMFETVYYNGELTSSPTFDMTNAKTLMTGTLFTDAVPEPTSGLLLLLGMGVLALKRKRA